MDGEREPNVELDRIWRRFLAGDNESFDLLYSQYVQTLFMYGLQLTADKELLKDCIQDVFVKLYCARTHLCHVSNIGSYLRVALKNRMINSLNREKFYLKSMDVSEVTFDEGMVEPDILYKEEELQKQNKIDAMMNLLTPQQRKVILYRYVEGLSLEDISLSTGVKYQSIQNTLQRAIKKIKKHYFPKK
ncbi:MAG: RNA polymerase sigma factor [Proteiniphilum sp.]|uniref:RNA polymerase sigma factor n=1 Tax=Proteiniphilum sp. TaxID=1926877 RepID=UPI002B1FB29E|nr:RNA polymerase sigma factor [Proteiniphilum sp.]MEA5126724.1 RNA polymerase sigma factor [Proteiniphilum sp.]